MKMILSSDGIAHVVRHVVREWMVCEVCAFHGNMTLTLTVQFSYLCRACGLLRIFAKINLKMCIIIICNDNVN